LDNADKPRNIEQYIREMYNLTSFKVITVKLQSSKNHQLGYI